MINPMANKISIKLLSFVLFLMLLTSVQAKGTLVQQLVNQTEAVQCSSPRPDICYDLYQPVCGISQTGEQQTYDNDCSACLEPEVESFIPGTSCEQQG